MQRFLSWLKKYFVIFVAFALVIAAVIMTVDVHNIVKIDEIVGEGKDVNHTISTREEFDALWGNAVAPLMAAIAEEQAPGVASAPAFQSLTLYMTSNSSESGEGFTGKYEESYMLALTADVIYLKCKWSEDEVDTEDGETEYICEQIEYYIIENEIYARISQCDLIENGIEMTEALLQQRGETDFEGIPVAMGFGNLFGKWVRVTGTRLADSAMHEISYAYELAREINVFGTFTPGEEPSIVREYALVTQEGPTYWVEGHPSNADLFITDTLQYKYINNTVIEDINDKKIYDLKDYL